MHPHDAMDKDDCCENKSFELEGQELDVTVPQYTIDIVLPVILAVVADVVQLPESAEAHDQIIIANHDPPDHTDFLSLIQVYRL